ncbi:MAG TPA: hypothetical protein P5560_10370 [Thermotogota bacterium]|nr:hypothetical protein [Thermotogota bacterium]HRW93340.1 hypothetical protein [Thermotogota bacterium]
MALGSRYGLIPFVQQRWQNVRDQLSGVLPSSGDGSGLGQTDMREKPQG